MTKDEIKTRLHEGIINVSFTKANGEQRMMKCTLEASLLPEPTVEEATAEPKVQRKENPDVQVVWDLDKAGWRSFRYDSVLEVT